MSLVSLIALIVGVVGAGTLLGISIIVHHTGYAQRADKLIFGASVGAIVLAFLIQFMPGLLIAITAIGFMIAVALIISAFNIMFPEFRGIKASIREWLKDE